MRHLAAIRREVGQLSDDLHDLAYKLHPSLLEHVGLQIAVQDHVAEFTKRTGLPVTVARPRGSPPIATSKVSPIPDDQPATARERDGGGGTDLRGAGELVPGQHQVVSVGLQPGVVGVDERRLGRDVGGVAL